MKKNKGRKCVSVRVSVTDLNSIHLSYYMLGAWFFLLFLTLLFDRRKCELSPVSGLFNNAIVGCIKSLLCEVNRNFSTPIHPKIFNLLAFKYCPNILTL